MAKSLKFKSYRDFSKGTWQGVQSSLVPINSVRLALNYDSDVELGSMVSRLGTTLVGSQIIDGKDILGLHNYRDSIGSNSKLFAVVSDGTNSDIYDVLTGAKSLEDDSSPVSVSISPSVSVSVSPSTSISPSVSVSISPSVSLSVSPSVSPSFSPANTVSVSISPSISPSVSPSFSPSGSSSPSLSPSVSPSVSVSISPSVSTSLSPSRSPSLSPSRSPSVSPSRSPSRSPSISPSVSPPNSYSVSISASTSPSTSPSSSISPSVSPSAGSYVGLKTRFLTYLNSCLRLNGVDPPKAFENGSWVTTGGAFNLDTMPQSAKYALEFKDRVYVAGMTDSPDKVEISGIADSTTKTVSWTSGNKFFLAEQEDGGGGITGLAKVPGYVLIFKKRTRKRYDGSSAYPEDMENQGAPSQEAIVTSQGMCFWVNENGVWASTGGTAKKISSFMVDNIVKSCSSEDLEDVASGTDEEHIFWSFKSVTILGETYTNVVLKYNISQQTWDVRKYATFQTVFTKYVDSSEEVFTVFGDNDGNVQKLDVGTTDNSTPIHLSFEPQDLDFGYRCYQKGINRIIFLTENISKGTLLWRNSHRAEDWKELGTIKNEVEDITGKDLRGNFFGFKIIESVDSGQAKVLGFEFPENSIKIYENTG